MSICMCTCTRTHFWFILLRVHFCAIIVWQGLHYFFNTFSALLPMDSSICCVWVILHRITQRQRLYFYSLCVGWMWMLMWWKPNADVRCNTWMCRTVWSLWVCSDFKWVHLSGILHSVTRYACLVVFIGFCISLCVLHSSMAFKVCTLLL